MTNQQGPPLRFKAVNTENGSVLDPEFVTEMMFHHFDHMSFWWEPGKYLDHPLDDEKIILCQSTWLHDARGVEIYGGDVLIHSGTTERFDVVSFLDGCFICVDFLDLDADEGCFDFEHLHEVVDFMTIIGNRWQSREVLEQKAKEVILGD